MLKKGEDSCKERPKNKCLVAGLPGYQEFVIKETRGEKRKIEHGGMKERREGRQGHTIGVQNSSCTKRTWGTAGTLAKR